MKKRGCSGKANSFSARSNGDPRTLRMIYVLKKYGRENAFTVILDRSGQTSPVIFAANSVDVTQDIIRLFDQNYPAKAAATTPRTPTPQRAPAPKPATPPQQ